MRVRVYSSAIKPNNKLHNYVIHPLISWILRILAVLFFFNRFSKVIIIIRVIKTLIKTAMHNWIALQRKSASPVEIHAVFCCLRHNGLEQYTSSFLKTIRTDATFNFTCVLGSITKLEFYTRTLRHFKNDDYQNGLADILCKAIHIFFTGIHPFYRRTSRHRKPDRRCLAAVFLTTRHLAKSGS